MGKPQARVGDYSMGHWISGIFYFPPKKLIQGSPDTFSCGPAASRVGDSAETHFAWIFGIIPLPAYTHTPTAAVGAPTTFINGRQAFRVTDKYDCGDMQAEGCPLHLVG